MMQQRPSEAEENELTKPGSEKAIDRVEMPWVCRGKQPPDEQKHAEIQGRAGDPMHDGHRHRNGHPINLQMRRKWPLGLGSFLNPAGSQTGPVSSGKPAASQ